MKNSILLMCSVVAVAGMTAAAQQPQPQTPPTQQTPPTPQTPPTQQTPPAQPSPTQPEPNRPMPDAPRPMADAASSTTVTGCLKTWDARTMAPATGVGSGAGSAAAGAAAGATAGVASTAGVSEFVLTNVEGERAAGAKGSFLLKTSDSSISFSQHQNHKVSLTGTIADAAKATGQAMADKPVASATAGRMGADDVKLPVLNVTALKMVSPTCGS